MSGETTVFFDSTPKLRVVDEDKFKDTQALHEECTNFTKSKSRAVLLAPTARAASCSSSTGALAHDSESAADSGWLLPYQLLYLWETNVGTFGA